MRHPSGDAKRTRVVVVLSRPAFLQASCSTAICAPVYTRFDGLSTQVPVGPKEGLKHASSIHCDALLSVPRAALTDFIGSLGPAQTAVLDDALRAALAVECDLTFSGHG